MGETITRTTRTTHRTADLGVIDPASSRHGGRRSALALTDDVIYTGTANGTLAAHDRASFDERWRAGAGIGSKRNGDGDRESGAIISAIPFAGGVAVGERSANGEIRLHDAHGTVRWRYSTAADVGDPQKETRFLLPFVVDLVEENDHLYAAARRYERSGGGGDGNASSGDEQGNTRSFESCVYAFDAEGAVEWTYRTDASPISLDVRGDRVAVAYNRCPGEHRDGLVVLDADSGGTKASWDPPTDGTVDADASDGGDSDDRRIGDVSLLDTGLVCTSHADYRGYRLDTDCEPVWSTELATEQQVGSEVLYAYPNHCHATDQGISFLTGNTYARESRETDSLHPAEHTAFGYTLDGERRWRADVGGFVTEIGTDGDRLVAPCGQNFRTRDPASHALRVFDVRDGPRTTLAIEGVVTAAAIDGTTIAAIEEPVIYHDDGMERGAYRLHADTVQSA